MSTPLICLIHNKPLHAMGNALQATGLRCEDCQANMERIERLEKSLKEIVKSSTGSAFFNWHKSQEVISDMLEIAKYALSQKGRV